jgi:hypothetical protein
MSHLARFLSLGLCLLWTVSAHAQSYSLTTLDPAPAASQLGFNVTITDDVTGDGHPDMLVTAGLEAVGGAPEVGRVYLYEGGPGFDAVPDLVFDGETTGDRFGTAIVVGDLDGDAAPEIAISAPFHDSGGLDDAGRVYLFDAGAALDATPDLILDGRRMDEFFGASLALGADVTGDGRPELFVGAPFDDAPATEPGWVYAFEGGATFDATFDLLLEGDALGDQFGRALATGGDLNDDGQPDLVVGAPTHDTAGSEAGRVYVYHGGAAFDTGFDATFDGAVAFDFFGAELLLTEITGDGTADLLVGAPFVDAGGLTNAGRVYVYQGSPAPGLLLTLDGTQESIRFGARLAAAGDASGDGAPDLLVGAPRAASGGNDPGAVFRFDGGAALDGTPDFVFPGAAPADRFGRGVSAGDVNGDGCPDVIIGAPLSDASAPDAGRAYLYVCEPEVAGVSLNDYDIYAFTPNSGAIRVTFLDGTGEFNPSWFPFGPILIHDVAAFDADDAFLGQDLYLTYAPTGASIALPGGEDGNDAAFAPFGLLVAFDRAPFPAPSDPSLYLLPVWGGTPIAVRSDAVDADWSPSGRYLVFHQPSDGSIRTLDLLTGGEVLVTGDGTNPAWSPDGRFIAFARSGDLYRVRVGGDGTPLAAPEQITTDPANDGQPSWTPGSQRLVFQSDRSSDFDVWTTQADGTTSPVFVTGLPGVGDFDPDVAPFAAVVAYAGFTAPSGSAPVASEFEMDAPDAARDLRHRIAATGIDLERLAKRYRLGSSRALIARGVQWTRAADRGWPGLRGRGAGQETSAPPADAEGLAAAAYPNPFNPTTTLRFTLPAAADVRLEVFDLLGRRVATLVDGPLDAGTHAVPFDAAHLPSGTYLYRMQAGGAVLTQRMTLVK